MAEQLSFFFTTTYLAILCFEIYGWVKACFQGPLYTVHVFSVFIICLNVKYQRTVLIVLWFNAEVSGFSEESPPMVQVRFIRQ